VLSALSPGVLPLGAVLAGVWLFAGAPVVVRRLGGLLFDGPLLRVSLLGGPLVGVSRVGLRFF